MTCIQLMRPKHWIKNIIIFIPVFFSGRIFVLLFTGGGRSLSETLIGFVSFSFMASAVYVFNDMRDVEKDRKHPIKKNRPIASGKVTKRAALLLLAVCVGISSGLNLVIQQYIGLGKIGRAHV